MTWKQPENFTAKYWDVGKAEAIRTGQILIFEVPVPHFGVVLEWYVWHALEARLRSHNIKFIIEPYIRFKGQPGEQATMFFLDPSGNALEFKSFQDINQLFAV